GQVGDLESCPVVRFQRRVAGGRRELRQCRQVDDARGVEGPEPDRTGGDLWQLVQIDQAAAGDHNIDDRAVERRQVGEIDLRTGVLGFDGGREIVCAAVV